MVVAMKGGCHKRYCTPTLARQPRTVHSRSKVIIRKVVHLSGRFPRPHIRREGYHDVKDIFIYAVYSLFKIYIGRQSISYLMNQGKLVITLFYLNALHYWTK